MFSSAVTALLTVSVVGNGFSMVLNFLVLRCLWKHWHNNYVFSFHIATVDLILSIMYGVWGILDILRKEPQSDHEILQFGGVLLQGLNASVVMFLLSMTLYQYRCIVLGLKEFKYLTLLQWIMSIWIFSFLFAVIPLLLPEMNYVMQPSGLYPCFNFADPNLSNHIFLWTDIVLFLLTTSAIFGFHYLLYYKLKAMQREAQVFQRMHLTSVQRTIAGRAVYLVCGFLFMWTPMAATLMYCALTNQFIPQTADYVVVFLGRLNPCVNSILLLIVDPRFRQLFFTK